MRKFFMIDNFPKHFCAEFWTGIGKGGGMGENLKYRRNIHD